MESARTIARLRDLADDVRALGATSLYLFGSTLRDEATGASDLDVLIDYDLLSRFGTVLRHDCHGLSDRIIWGVVTDELPRLRLAVEALKRRFDGAR